MSDEYVGLEDMGKTNMNCLGCAETIGIIWDVDPNEDDMIKVKAKCPFCSGLTKTFEVRKNSRIGIPDGDKITHIDFGDYDNGIHELLPAKKG